MNDNKIKEYCKWARKELLAGVENRMQRYGIVEEGAAPASAETIGGFALSVQEVEQRKQLLQLQSSLGHDDLRDRAVYTWFNRLIAIRFMELHDYLPCGMHVLSDVEGRECKPQVVKEALDVEIEGANPEEIARLMQAGEDEPLFRYLLLAQCNELAKYLPTVFEPVGSAMELLLPSNLLRDGSVVQNLVTSISVEDWLEQVQILGWMYQYYNAEVKDDFFKAKRKASAKDIAPATQLFTPEWIVRYMVENSLGRLWMLNFPESNLAESWEYYIQPDAEHEDFIHINGPEEITLCDPACGSGHILVYAFELLFQMYVWRGYRERDIPQLILENNLTGMEIDPRAAQIASLALAMCAREHDRRFFKRDVQADINVIAPTKFDEGELPEGAALLQQPQLVDALAHLDEVGSLLNPTEAELSALNTDVKRFASGEGQASLFGNNLSEKLEAAQKTCETLARKFTCVVANPPYMGSSSFSPFMSKWIKKHYPDVKSDLFASFIVRIMSFCDAHGEVGLMTPFVWMFIGSYEKLRKKLIESKTITSLVQLEYSGFAGATVPICTFTLHNSVIDGYEGGYVRLSDFVGAAKQAPKTREAVANPNCGYFYRRNAKTFTQIPGTPIAYWASDALIGAFGEGLSIESYSDYTGSQNITADNDKYLRLWWEIDQDDESAWVPYSKGGLFRRWYGNYEYVVDWSESAKAFYRENPTSNLLKEKYWFQPGITYSDITSGKSHFRYLPGIGVFDKKGPEICRLGNCLEPTLAFLNSSLCQEYLWLLNPSMTLQIADVKKLPILSGVFRDSRINVLTSANIDFSKSDYDSFETSWDFKRHPLA